jgi:hypothetical protein
MSAMQINEKRRRQQGKPMTMVYQGLMAQLMLLLLLLMLPLQAVHGQTPIGTFQEFMSCAEFTLTYVLPSPV